MAVRMLDTATLTILASTPVEGRTPVQTDVVKTWAEKNGYKVTRGQKGRMSMEVVNAFNSAHKTKQYITSAPAPEVQSFTYKDENGRTRKFKAAPADVRAWAREQADLTVGARGRFTQEVINAYGRAHR